MAQATVCDPCFEHEQLAKGEEIPWSLNGTDGTLVLCQEHLLQYAEMFVFEHKVEDKTTVAEYVCELDGRTFEKPQGLNMHKMRAHG